MDRKLENEDMLADDHDQPRSSAELIGVAGVTGRSSRPRTPPPGLGMPDDCAECVRQLGCIGRRNDADLVVGNEKKGRTIVGADRRSYVIVRSCLFPDQPSQSCCLMFVNSTCQCSRPMTTYNSRLFPHH